MIEIDFLYNSCYMITKGNDTIVADDIDEIEDMFKQFRSLLKPEQWDRCVKCPHLDPTNTYLEEWNEEVG